MKHILKIKGESVEFSTAEAKKLLAELKEAFDEPSFPPVVIPQPYPVYPPPQEWQPPWIITCEAPIVARPAIAIGTPVMQAN